MSKRRCSPCKETKRTSKQNTTGPSNTELHASKELKTDAESKRQPLPQTSDEDELSDGEASLSSTSFSSDGAELDSCTSTISHDKIKSFIPQEDDELDYSPDAYDMLHHLTLDWSCFSFDILPDKLGASRMAFPHTFSMVAGIQVESDALQKNLGRLYVMKVGNLTKMNHSNDTDSCCNQEEEGRALETDSTETTFECRSFEHPGNVNRLRVCPLLPRLVSTWSDNGCLYLWDIHHYMEALESSGKPTELLVSPKLEWNNNKKEGFALDFHPSVIGLLASGSRDAVVRIFRPINSGWNTETTRTFQKYSVEDVSWKKLGNPNILASASIDKSLSVYDISLGGNTPQIHIPNAHESDVNSIAWSPHDEELLLSGGDDGVIRVWDMRNFSQPITHFTWHKKPITSVDWHPTDSSVIAASSLDNSVTIWDMSVEPCEDTPENDAAVMDDYPQQLMFQHMGQTHISEMKWHPQIPGVLISTAEDGFNIFKPCNI